MRSTEGVGGGRIYIGWVAGTKALGLMVDGEGEEFDSCWCWYWAGTRVMNCDGRREGLTGLGPSPVCL